MSSRYPSSEPDAFGRLEVGDGQSLYWETSGNPEGLPAVFLHGGPGGGVTRGAARNFDPSAYRVVLFDQRGCGRSTPSAGEPRTDLSINTTAHLVADLERLRGHLGVDRWVVVGVSWGVTLGLVYAQRHPERVVAMVLGAVTTGDRHETEWITRAMGRIFPREWEEFVRFLPETERDGDLSAAYARMLNHHDPNVREVAAQRWCEWEDTHVSLAPDWQPSPRYKDPSFRMTFARLVTHYWSHGSFLTDGEVLAGLARLESIPAVLIHGRYDVSGPLGTAWRLHRRWPGSRLVVLDDAGHGGGDFPGQMTAALDGFCQLS